MLKNKLVVLGVTGSVAAVKSVELARLLMAAGSTVQVVMTAGATQFVTELTMEAVTGKPVASDMFDTSRTAALNHIDLARAADLIIVAPTTAETMAKIAGGHASDLLSAVLLAADCPVLLAPAMNSGMWVSPATQSNAKVLRERGIAIAGPVEGALADFSYGEGRMMDPAGIVAAAEAEMRTDRSLSGKKVMITGGGTREFLDPVRYLGNPSTGKMAVALAAEAVKRGAEVVLVAAPMEPEPPAGCQTVRVVTAEDMRGAVMKGMGSCDALIMCAAVTDYHFEGTRTSKIKRTKEPVELKLVPTGDILAEAVAAFPDKAMVGFAAETGDIVTLGRAKFESKGVDILVANTVGDPNIGFGSDRTEFTIVGREGHTEPSTTTKHKAAGRILAEVAKLLNA